MAIYEADVGSHLPDLGAERVLQHKQKRPRLSCSSQWDDAGTRGGLPREIHSLLNSLETFIATHSLYQLEGEFMHSSQHHHFIKCLKCRYTLGAQIREAESLLDTFKPTLHFLAGLQSEALHFIRTSLGTWNIDVHMWIKWMEISF